MINIDPSKEPVIIVDRDDNQVAIAPRAEVENNVNKIIRYVYILLYNQEEQILIQRRHADLARFPNYWDISASGAVRPEEGYPAAAERKLQDELGLSVKLYHEHKDLLPIAGQAGRMAAIFVGEVKDITVVSPNAVKVSEVRWVQPVEAAQGYLLTPSFSSILTWWAERKEQIMKTISRDASTTT